MKLGPGGSSASYITQALDNKNKSNAIKKKNYEAKKMGWEHGSDGRAPA
jgi:hypothetical protein